MFTISVTYTKRSQIRFQNFPICHNHIKQCPSLRSFISLKCNISKIIQKTSSIPIFTFYVKYSEEVCHCDSGLAPNHFVFLYKTFTNVGFLIKPHLWWVPKILKSLRKIFYIDYFGKTLLMSWASWARLMNPEGKSTLKRQQSQSLKKIYISK